MKDLDYRRWADLSDLREAGEVLTPHERVELEEISRDNACARREQALLHELREAPGPDDDLGRARLVEAALAAVRADPQVAVDPEVERRFPARDGRRRWAAIALAAAALALVPALVLGLRARKSVEGAAGLAFRGLVEVNGRPATPGARLLRQGDLVALASNPDAAACLALEGGIDVCLAPGSRLRLTALGRPGRQLELLTGRLVAKLDRQPPGDQFTVAAGNLRASALGTVFAVALDGAPGRATALVLEGKVSVTHAGAETDVEAILAAHAKVSADAAGPRPITTTTAEEEAASWALLRSLHPAPSAAVEGAPLASAPEPIRGRRARAPQAPRERPPSSGDRGEGPDLLLDQARRLMASARWRQAADTYRTIEKRHPGSPTARAAMVALGELQLSHLGQPRAALASFSRYLEGGEGPLEQEALYGRIRALRALGNPREERAAIERYLHRHPRSLEAPALRARLEALDRT